MSFDGSRKTKSSDVFLSTMIDLYALPADFPGMETAPSECDPCKRVKHIETALGRRHRRSTIRAIHPVARVSKRCCWRLLEFFDRYYDGRQKRDRDVDGSCRIAARTHRRRGKHGTLQTDRLLDSRICWCKTYGRPDHCRRDWAGNDPRKVSAFQTPGSRSSKTSGKSTRSRYPYVTYGTPSERRPPPRDSRPSAALSDASRRSCCRRCTWSTSGWATCRRRRWSKLPSCWSWRPAQVQDTLSFYGFFKQDKPQGRYRVWVCRSISCAACGGEELLEYLCEKLGIRPGETTADGRVTLEFAECLGALRRRPGDAGERHAAREHDQGKGRRVGRRK